jgi:hypothetical protein
MARDVGRGAGIIPLANRKATDVVLKCCLQDVDVGVAMPETGIHAPGVFTKGVERSPGSAKPVEKAVYDVEGIRRASSGDECETAEG